MAITKGAKKAQRSALRKRVFNTRRKRVMKDTVKEVIDTAKADPKKAAEKLSAAYRAIDKATKRGIIKKNTAARRKSRLARLVAAK
jgi:small subunit ribosomal protein S20